MLVWLPSVMLALIFLPNAIEKICRPDQLDKVITNPILLVIIGLILAVAVVMFLINKTMIWGAAILVLYMSMVALIHMYKGKPHEVVALIVVSTVFAAYIRQPHLFRGN